MSQIKLFESKQIRSVWNEAEEKWYFSVQDVIEVLTDSTDPKQYIKKMRKRDPELAKGWVQFVPTLWIDTPGGKQKMNCANSESFFALFSRFPRQKLNLLNYGWLK